MRSVRIRLVEFIISVAMELGVASDPGGSIQVCLSCALFGVRPCLQAWGNWGGRPGHGLANILLPFHTDLHTMSLGVASLLYTFLSNDSCG